MSIDLDSRYPVTDGDGESFRANGFIRLPKVLSGDTIARYEPEITRRVIELNTMHLPMEERSTYDKAFLQVTNLWRHSKRVCELVFSRRLARVAAELMGVRGVRLYHDQALYKEPGGGFTPWHADLRYWPLQSDQACTVWIPLQETPLEMGPVAFAAGSHHFEVGRDLPISDESEAALQEALAAQDFPLSQEPFALGDVSYHYGWTFHRAGPNRSAIPRRVMTIIYMDADMRVAEAAPWQEADLEAFLPGARVGEIADGPLTPVLHESRTEPAA